MFRFVFYFFLLTTSLFAHQPGAFSKDQKFLVNVPLLNMHVVCDELSSVDSQAIYGHVLSVVEELDGGWVLVETADRYRGYARREGLVPDQPEWRMSERRVHVSAVAGRVYPIPDTELPALLELSYHSNMVTLEEFDAGEQRWVQVQLIDGRKAWMQRGDLESPRVRRLEEVLELAFRFLERPYVWGGTSSFGYDCSGFVQLLCQKRGILLPRNAAPQSRDVQVSPVERGELKAGDLLFFGKERVNHVGLYLGENRFIQSGNHDLQPRVYSIGLDETNYVYREACRLNPVEFSSKILREGEFARVEVSHWGFDGCVHRGELRVSADLAEEMVGIFEELFHQQYPLEKMLLLEAYEGDQERSLGDNNTLVFRSDEGWKVVINPLLQKEGEDDCSKVFISRGWTQDHTSCFHKP